MVDQTLTGTTQALWMANANAAYSVAIASFLGLPTTAQYVSSFVVSSSVEEHMRMLQSSRSSVTVRTVITSASGTQPQIRAALLGNPIHLAIQSVLAVGISQSDFIIFSTPMPSTISTPAPTTPIGLNSAQRAVAQQGGLSTTTIVGIVVAILVVAVAATYIVYAMTRGKKSDIRGSNVAAVYNSYRNQDEKFGAINPAGFAPHIARGFPAQRYSGTSQNGRRSFGNSIELADYRASGYGDADTRSVMSSDNPHFAAPRLSLTRKSLAEHQMRSAAGGSPKYVFNGGR